MKTKLNLPNKNLSEENKKLKKIIKFLIEGYKATFELVKAQKEIIKSQERSIYLLECQKKIIAKELAKIDVHFHVLSDEEFKEHLEKNI
ncbi:hypothetical protein [Methanobrevibacter arboriphilus]|uniref:hypothetical protein n=1 Tax=Methanobrevibacter arboriphilus TaxID=39441 RepID=UPI0005B262AA|nr:hypothetical protein [Methanobrevibacter arboriphilus]